MTPDFVGRFWRRGGARGLVAAVLLLASGCVSARYKAADKNSPPPWPLNLAAKVSPAAPDGAPPPVTATVNTVIFYKGPGSWKRQAYWDEYVLTLTNPGETPLVLESASLTDFRGDTAAPGDNPWDLERASRTRAEEINRAAKTVLVQVGSGYLALGVSSLALIGGSAVLAAAFPVYVVGSIYANIDSRQIIEAEFARRRLGLPVTLAPHQTVQGSLFFRIAPGPRHFDLHFRSDRGPIDAVVELPALGGLHLKNPPPPASVAK